MFDEQPDGDPHGECAAEIDRLRYALREIALAGMGGTGQESEEAMRDWHARRAWEFIGIAARALSHNKPSLRDREADRQRFSDPDFNRWLDEGITDAGHTVWDQIGDVGAAWHGWSNRPWYTDFPPAPDSNDGGL